MFLLYNHAFKKENIVNVSVTELYLDQTKETSFIISQSL